MYGTLAKLKAKPGNADKVIKFLETEVGQPVGYRGRVIYQMDNDPDELWIAGWFESKEAYFTHSDKPETHQIYLRLLDLLVAEPEWHDGYIVFIDLQKEA
jgi:quinol monooxygenase YgiN